MSNQLSHKNPSSRVKVTLLVFKTSANAIYRRRFPVKINIPCFYAKQSFQIKPLLFKQ